MPAVTAPKAPYAIAAKSEVLRTDDVKVTLMTLDPGQSVPRHFHTAVTDTTFCLDGVAEVRMEGPAQTVRLTPGDNAAVSPNRVHTVVNIGTIPCRLLLIQGVGPYDFMAA